MTKMTRHADTAGLTMTELMMMVLVMSILMIMMTESMTTLSGVRVEQKTHFRIGDIADHVGRQIEHDIDYATRVFTTNADDLDYLQATAPGEGVLADGRRLPLLTDIGYFAPDPVASPPQTGNVLFLATRGPRLEIELASGGNRLVQVLRFVLYAPVETDGKLDLMRWVGDPMVSYWDVVAIQDAGARTEALADMYEHGVRYAWDPQAKRENGLFEVLESGALEQLASEKHVEGGEGEDSRPFRMRAMRLATASLPGVPVPAYARSTPGFAGGFEIKVDGSANGKLVMLRFVVVATEVVKRQIWTEIHRLVNTNG